MTKAHHIALLILLAATLSVRAQKPSQVTIPTGSLDPTRNLAETPQTVHPPLPEEYIWTAGDITVQRPDRSKYSWSRTNLRIAPHLFRTHFNLKTIPHNGTLYLAGPREGHVYLNGSLIGDFYSNTDAPIGFRVFHCDATHALRVGDNVLAIEAVRGRGVVSGAGPIETQQLAYGEILVAKLVPARFGVDAPALVFTNPSWKSSATPTDHWPERSFDDRTWKPAASLGPVESNVDFFQWSADAGMYGWPGYMGMSARLRTYSLQPVAVTHVFAGSATYSHLDALTDTKSDQPFTVSFSRNGSASTDAESPQILLDFGREVAGRLLVESGSPEDSLLSIAYGESDIESLATGLTSEQRGGNYLGTNLLDVPANGIARGPKSGFRYVRIRFLRGAPVSAYKSIRVEGIYDPVKYLGSFESSDPLLNRIWETGAYTAHLCMQDGVWDAVKRDRGRWVGDMDIEGRVISTVFGETEAVKDTLRRLAEATPPQQYVNGIASYSALWITTLYDFYQHSGDKDFLETQHAALLRILARMDQDIDANGNFAASAKGWGFVDWAPGLYGQTENARIGTMLQYLRGYSAALSLLSVLGDQENAKRYGAQSLRMWTAAKALRDPATKTLGETWQLNGLAVLEHLDNPDNPEMWNRVLSHVKQDAPADQVVSPYFNEYLLDAMAVENHRAEALQWMKAYWGGMLAEGATSFWESYDLRWPKTDPHLSLQADGTTGYFVSLAHGWSSGPTAWLTENVLGVTPETPGYQTVNLRPHLLGLEFVRGTVPTPHGVISVEVDRKNGMTFDLPKGVGRALVQVAAPAPGHRLLLDGKPIDTNAPASAIQTIEVNGSGHHTVEER